MADFPNLRHLRALLEVALSHGVSAAADKVHLSQPAITQAIAKIEQGLGAELFERRPDGMFPTELGALFLQRVRKTLDHIQLGVREAARLGLSKEARRAGDADRRLTATQLRALAVIADTGSFSLAARTLGISQPAVHRAARELERLMGMELFTKSSTGIDLTAAAQAFVKHVNLAFAELQQGYAEVAYAMGRDSGRIVIGTMPLARTRILPEAIAEIARQRPQVEIRVIDGPYGDLLHRLRHGEIDVLVGALRDPPPVDDVGEERLFDDPLSIVAGSGHPLCRRSEVSAADLTAFPWVVPPEGTPTRDFFLAMFAERGLTPPPHLIESSSLILIRGLLSAGEHLTIMSRQQAQFEPGLAFLSPVDIDMSASSRPIGLTFRNDWRATATQAQVLEQLRAAAISASAITGNEH